MAHPSRPTLITGGGLDRAAPHLHEVKNDRGPAAESVGQDLRRTRERLGRELHDVWRVLKIRTDYLAAIEESRYEALPGRLYALGYVRSYAAYLQLDHEEFVARLKMEFAAREPVADPLAELLPPAKAIAPDCDTNQPIEPLLHAKPAREPAKHSAFEALRQVESPLRGNPKALALRLVPLDERKAPQGAIAAMLLAVVIFSGYYLFASRAVQPPVAPVPERLALAAGLVQIPRPEPPPDPAPAPKVASPPAPASTLAPAPAPAEQLASLVLPEPALSPPDDVKVTPPVLVPTGPAPKPQVLLPTGRHYGTSNKNSRITLRVHRPMRVAVQGTRNRVFIDRTLVPGDTYRVPNELGLRLTAPDAGAVELLLDGGSLGFVGEAGEAVKSVPLSPRTVAGGQQVVGPPR